MPKTKVVPGPAGGNGSSRTISPLFKKKPFMNHSAATAALVCDSYAASPTSNPTSIGVAGAEPSPSTTYFGTQNYNPPNDVASMVDGYRPVPAETPASTPNITSTTSSITTPTSEPKVVKARRPPSTQSLFRSDCSAVPKPILYVAVILERPETLKSWGLVFTKEARDNALIVRVIPPSKLNGPSVKWCGITNSTPNSFVLAPTLYGKKSSDIPLDIFETTLVRHFPPPCTDRRLTDAGLLVPNLTPGDAIVAINGIPVSEFPTMLHFASYIRENCKRKMTVVAMRHENVRSAALGRTLAQLGGVDQQNDWGRASENQTANDQIAKAVKGAWKLVLFYRSNNKVKRKVAPLPAEKKRPKIYIPPVYTNGLFRDERGAPILYCDNNDYDPEDGERIHGFMNVEIENTFHQWLKKRKANWGERRPRKCNSQTAIGAVDEERGESTVQPEFWLANGHDSFDQWLSASKSKWMRSYSWHIARREALQSECEKEVHFPMIATTIETQVLLYQFGNWLSTRKQQWRLERRKRQRCHVELPGSLTEDENTGSALDTSSGDGDDPNTFATNSNQTMYFDEILEVEEERLAVEEGATPHHLMDISWVFDSQQGTPDDIIANIMAYLLPSDHGNLLCLSFTCNFLFKQRHDMWKSLCPKHWVLPRRPRKSWSAMYITKIRAEEETSRKRSDDLLVKANVVIDKGDQLNKLDKLVRKGERDFDFSVNYISCVVLERNSLTNMAVIAKRHKIIKWLIEEKLADIESCDRGQFTPLMNAAWNGDKHIVRYLLGKGSDRTKVGYNHCSQGLAPPSFKGLTAEGWARKRGHKEVADLIRFGL